MRQPSRPSIVILGCGYVGGELARQALKRGYRVTTLTRNSTTAAKLKHMGVHQVVIAELDSKSWHRSIDPHSDWVVNCVSSAGRGLDGYRKSYLYGQQSIVTWADQGSIGTFIYTSSTSVYPQSGNVWVREKDATSTGLHERGRILLEAEQVVRNADFSRWFILRLSGIYGPFRHSLLDQLRAGTTTFEGSGERTLNLIYRDDICSSIWAALKAPKAVANRIFNVVDDAPTPKKTIASWLAKRLDCPPPVFVPQKEMSKPSLRTGERPNRRIGNEKIKSELSWQPVYADFTAGYTKILADMGG